jgi:hypothetical protein
VRYIEKKTSRDFISNFPRYILLLLLLLLVGLQSRAHPSTVFFFKKGGDSNIYSQIHTRKSYNVVAVLLKNKKKNRRQEISLFSGFCVEETPR